MPDIRTMLAASSADDGAPLPGILARAMVYSQDADRKLDRARAMKQEAARYRDEIQQQTVDQTETFCAEAREKAQAEYDEARKLRTDAEETYDAARAELGRAATIRVEADAYAEAARAKADDHAGGVRSEADAYAAAARAEADGNVEGIRSQASAHADGVRAEADAYGQSTRAQAAADAKALLEQAQHEAATAAAEQQERMEDEVRHALRGVEKMQSAAQAELEAQQMYTEALRFRTASPTWTEPAPAPPRSVVPKGSRTAKRRAA